MILHLQNLAWDCPSPSHLRLVLPRPREDVLDISFLGDRWCLFVERQGHVSSHCFPTRDQAVALVAQAFKNEGVLG